MTYSGVGNVVPSMTVANTNASSQNAARRETASLRRPAAAGWPRQSIQAESGIRPAACGIAVVVGRSRSSPVTVELMWGHLLLSSSANSEPHDRRGEPASHGRVIWTGSRKVMAGPVEEGAVG